MKRMKDNIKKNEKKTNRLKKRYIVLAVVLLLAIFVAFDLWASKHLLTTTDYSIETSKLSDSFRIVQLTDLHNSTFGEDNSKLVAAVEAENPDVILITGDLINSKDWNNEDSDDNADASEYFSIATNLISDLKEIAPVYVSYGNQEDALEADGGVDITKFYTDAGATVLNYDYLDTEIKGQKVRIGGIYGYCVPFRYAEETDRMNEAEFLEEFQDTDRYTILMCHMPVEWLIYNSLYDYQIDCVFAGHAHGGQIRIPFVGGLWAPDQGWFPGQECGVYETNEEEWKAYREETIAWAKNQDETCDTSFYTDDQEYEPSYLVLSRGLGNTDWMPRFNNIPEVVSVELGP